MYWDIQTETKQANTKFHYFYEKLILSVIYWLSGQATRGIMLQMVISDGGELRTLIVYGSSLQESQTNTKNEMRQKDKRVT